MRRGAVAVFGLTVGLSTAVRAQVCTGSTSFAYAPLQLTGAAAYNADGRSFNAGLGFGSRGPFAHAILGKTHYDESGASSTDLGFGAGYQIALGDPDGIDVVELCPLVSWAHANGPMNVDVSGIGTLIADIKQTMWMLGVGIGTEARSGATQIVLAGSAAMAKKSVTISGGASPTERFETVAVLEFGVGFIFNQSFALRPNALVVAGDNNTTATVGLSAVLSIVRRDGR